MGFLSNFAIKMQQMRNFIIFSLFIVLGYTPFDAQCKTVTSISENFDAWKSIDKCWDTKSGLAMLYAKKQRITFYSMVTPKEDMYLFTPKLKAGSYTLTLDISANDGDASLQLISTPSTSTESSYASLGKPTKIDGGKKQYKVSLKKDGHIGLKVVLNDYHQAVFVDNLSILPRK